MRFDPVDTELGLGRAKLGPRCLVTGAAGFLGRALVKALLSRGYEVRGLDLCPPSETSEGLTWITGDIRDYECVKKAASGCRTVFHTAALLNFLSLCPAKLEQEIIGVNYSGTLNVIRACRESGVRALIYTSSTSVCYSPEPLVVGDEDLPYARDFLDVYAKSKTPAEQAVLAADDISGLRTVALRPAGLWGPGPGCYMLDRLVAELAKGKFVATIGNGKALADNTHVDNLVLAELLAAEKLFTAADRVGGQAYFITDEEPLNVFEWGRPLVEGLGYKVPRLAIPAGLMAAVALVGEWIHRFGGPKPLLSRLEVHNVTSSFTFKCDKARRELGYRPLVQRIQGLADCLPYYKELLKKIKHGSVPDNAARAQDRFEKIIYLLWAPRNRNTSWNRTILLDLAPSLLKSGAKNLIFQIADEEAKMRSPAPKMYLDRPIDALADVWVERIQDANILKETFSAAGFRVAAYQVDESIYCDYGGNRHSKARDWPDGERSPGIVAVTLMQRPGRLSRAEWIRRWHGRMSPVSEKIQPRARYVRNLVIASLNEDAPAFDGIVEEAWPSKRHVSNPFLFYGAKNPWQLAVNLASILGAVTSFLNLWQIRTTMMSEYFMKTDGWSDI
ncbi:MAG: NAD-dependent epimerase/dehydratase family protein [Deltaproteobacteria bacterium]|nr:NAD-dependent epimerase/dehydratase family protein [Deltaproteobacteria bacterium]